MIESPSQILDKRHCSTKVSQPTGSLLVTETTLEVGNLSFWHKRHRESQPRSPDRRIS
jgi:hypothetical protein